VLTRVLIVLFLLVVIPDAYIYYQYVRKWTSKWIYRLLSFIPSLILVVYFISVYANDDMRSDHQPMVGTFMMIFLLLTAPKMLFTIFDSIGLLSKHISQRPTASLQQVISEDELSTKKEELSPERIKRGETIHRYVRLFAMALALYAAFIIIYGFLWGRSRYQVYQHTVYFDNLPEAFDGYRILQFSDLHVGTFNDGHQSDVTTIVNLINRQKCDVVLFTGDIVNYESRELQGYEQTLSSINAPDGVFSILGNHDYDMYLAFSNEQEKNQDIEIIKKKEKDFGWKLLLNENHILRRGNDSIAIIGTENDGLPPWPALGDLGKATSGLHNIMRDSIGNDQEPHTFSVLLTHDPTYWRRGVIPQTRIDLTLSGHTHAGQFKLFGWSPIQWKYDEWSGFYEKGPQLINVNDGIGQILLPFRFGAWPAIDVITLKKNNNEKRP